MAVTRETLYEEVWAEPMTKYSAPEEEDRVMRRLVTQKR